MSSPGVDTPRSHSALATISLGKAALRSAASTDAKLEPDDLRVATGLSRGGSLQVGLRRAEHNAALDWAVAAHDDEAAD